MSIIDAIKTIGKMGVPLRGHRDISWHQPDVGEPENHPGVRILIKFINFVVWQGNQTLGHHLRTLVVAGRRIYQKQHQTFF